MALPRSLDHPGCRIYTSLSNATVCKVGAVGSTSAANMRPSTPKLLSVDRNCSSSPTRRPAEVKRMLRLLVVTLFSTPRSLILQDNYIPIAVPPRRCTSEQWHGGMILSADSIPSKDSTKRQKQNLDV